MRHVQGDDPEAFAALYDRHCARAYRVARSVCGDAGRAEDAVQEGFLSQAAVITLAFLGELTHTEIAAQLALPEGTVKGRMRLGLKKLRMQMDGDGEVELKQAS